MVLSRLAARLDTWNGDARARAFRTGWPAKTRDDISFFDTGKVQYRYRARGAGRTIVFAADPPGTIELYDELLALFATRFRAIVIEAPAMGFSAARGGYGFAFRETNDDIARFLEAVAGPGAVLAFSCAAGLGAADIAARRPDLVSALVLLQTTDWDGFQTWKAKRDPKKILAKPFVGQLAMRKIAASRAPMWFDLAVGRRDMMAPFCACAAETLAHGAGWALASAYQRYIYDGPSPLTAARQPTLAIWGAADRSHGPDAPARAMNLASRVERITLDGIGHFPELEDTRRTFELISDFADKARVGA